MILNVPSGKLSHYYGKSPCKWEIPLKIAIFNSKLLVYQRVYPMNIPFIDGLPIKNGHFQ